MWRPDFDLCGAAQALLHGHHRRLCIYSYVHRGSPERPGLVMGLDRGGACRGIAYRIEAAQLAGTLDYLRAREQVTAVYVESAGRCGCSTATARMVRRWSMRRTGCTRNMPGGSRLEEQLRHVLQGSRRVRPTASTM